MSLSRHILLLESDSVFRQTLSDLLTQAGHQVTACAALPADLTPFHLVLGESAGTALPHIAISKPVRLAPLLSKIAALPTDPAACPYIGPWRFRKSARLLENEQGRIVRLTDKETAILDFLLHQSEAVGKEQLLTELWGYSRAVSTHTLETHIYRLRQKIEPDPAQASLLLTEAGGYRLNSAQSE